MQPVGRAKFSARCCRNDISAQMPGEISTGISPVPTGHLFESDLFCVTN